MYARSNTSFNYTILVMVMFLLCISHRVTLGSPGRLGTFYTDQDDLELVLPLPTSAEIMGVQHYAQVKYHQLRTETLWFIVLGPRKSNIQVPASGDRR